MPQVRVMPNCWYVLVRFFLRVDRMFVRLREARLFCDLRQVRRLCLLHQSGMTVMTLSCVQATSASPCMCFGLQPKRLVRELKHSEVPLAALSGGAPGKGVSWPTRRWPKHVPMSGPAGACRL